jgi:hypothetical protein
MAPADPGPAHRKSRACALPSVVTQATLGVRSTRTSPSLAVTHALIPSAAHRLRTSGCGWPNGFSAPADAMTARARNASRNRCVLDVRLP